MNKIEKKKINLLEFDYLRAIGISLVVIGHSFPYIDETDLKFYKYIHSLIYSFHMPLFLMISGFFAYKILHINSIKEYRDFVISKLKRLIVPYFVISSIAIPIKLLLNKFSERTINLSTILRDILLYPWRNPIIFFWFLYVLFLIFVFSPLIAKMGKYTVLTIFTLLSIIPFENIEIFGTTTILKYSIYFFIGVYLRDFYINNRNKILNYNMKSPQFFLSVLILFLIFILNINVSTSSENLFIITIFNFLQILKALIGIYLTFILSLSIYRLKSNFKLTKTLKVICNYSFDIFLLSWFPQIFARILFYQLLHLNYNLVVIISIIIGFTPIVFSKFIFRKFAITRKLILGIV